MVLSLIQAQLFRFKGAGADRGRAEAIGECHEYFTRAPSTVDSRDADLMLVDRFR
jgi:hypothetical protein